MMTPTLRTLIAAALLTLPLASFAQTPAPTPEKPFWAYATLEYVEDGKRKTKPMFIAIGPDDFRIAPKYLDKKKTIEAQGGIVIPHGTPFTAEYSAMGSTSSFNWGFGITTNNRNSYLLVKTGDTQYLLKILEPGKTQLFLSELERRTKVKVVVASGK